MPWRLFLLLLCHCTCVLASMSAQAGVVIDTTRLVYPAKAPEISVRLSNEGAHPALVQAWIDDGNADAKPDEVDVPFVIMPPLARINPSKGQTLRIAYAPQTGIAKERESVFWLNVLDVPPLPSVAVTNHMQLAFRTRLKLFFRPDGLPGSATEAAEKLHWSLIKTAAGTVLRVRNEAAFHVSFSSVAVRLKDGRSLQAQSRMLAPKTSADFPLGQALDAAKGQGSVVYDWINDYGTAIRRETQL